MGKRRTAIIPLNRLLAGIAVGAVLGSAVQAADRAHVVNIYAWESYFPKTVIDKFQSESGMHVNYSQFDSPDAAETALSVGSSNYDVVTMNASPQLAREIPKGFWKKLDRAAIPNARNADPRILQVLEQVDPGNAYAVPWMWGTTGLIYDADKAKAILGGAPIAGLDVILDRSIAAKFEKCGISVLDSWQDILPMVARYLGQPQLSADPAKLDAVIAKLTEIRPLIRRIASSGYYEQIADGELCLAIGYSGDAMIARRMAKEGNTKVRIDYAYAREMVPLFVDSMAVPADSPNPAGAALFINFMMRPEISAEVTRFIGFASGNAAAVALLDAALRDNAAVYPPAAVRARFELIKAYSPEESRLFTRAWQRFKTGQ
ncbi:MAG TPA: extracellular solute-binding protein [Steroidobacteraceae bacterium]|nr:extracellular solute-binding protein [Steroidobacteraceae bacterium]